MKKTKLFDMERGFITYPKYFYYARTKGFGVFYNPVKDIFIFQETHGNRKMTKTHEELEILEKKLENDLPVIDYETNEFI